MTIEEKDSGRWYIFDLYTPHNGKITVKESDPSQLFVNLEMLTENLTNFMKAHQGFSLTPQNQQAPTNKIAMTDATGVPIVDAQTMEPVMVDLPSDTHVFTIKEAWHDQTKTGKDVLKVSTVETYQYSGKYGISCFQPNDPAFDGWKSWPVGTKYAPPKGANKVLVRDPKDGGKYADILEFRA
jgi:hypothetical protein